MDGIRNGFINLMEHILEKAKSPSAHPACQFQTGKPWLDLQFSRDDEVVPLEEVESRIDDPPGSILPEDLDKIQGSLFGLAIGDTLGTFVEFKSREYLLKNPVKDLGRGGEWHLKRGQFTDNTSLALCLANSLVGRRGFVPYDQLVRYKWWYKHGYMSSIGKCFKLGASTKDALDEFTRRQYEFAKRHKIPVNELDNLSERHLIEQFPINCSKPGVAGSGALMRLAPIPLFFRQHLEEAIQLSGYSGQITHDDVKAYDACRYFAALIFAILNGYTKPMLLDRKFYENHRTWFGKEPLCDEIKSIAEGSYQKKGGYDDGIRGKGYIVHALEAALWGFWSDEDSFEKGVLAVVNLGDDTDTTAAIYGQLAGAFYGYKKLPRKWVDQIYAKRYLLKLSKWLAYEGRNWKETHVILSLDHALADDLSYLSAQNMIQGNSSTWNCPIRWKKSYKIPLTPTMPRHNLGFPDLSAPSSPASSVRFRNNNRPGSFSNERLSYPSTSEIISPTDMFGNSIQIAHLPPATLYPVVTSSEETNPIHIEIPSPPEIRPSEPPDPSQCRDWCCEDVCNWIRSLGSAYEPYTDKFRRYNIDGDRLLNFIDEEALVEFEVLSALDRQVILYSIEQLRARYATPIMPDNTDISPFDSQFVGDFVLPFSPTESTYPNTMSCILKPFEDKTHSEIYKQVVEWLGPLPSTVDIDHIELVHNPESYRIFLHQLNRTERKQTQEAFQPHLDKETNPIERKKVLDHLQTIIEQVKHNRKVPVVRVWHGCKREILSPLISDGFAALGQLDNGWFGKAIYFTSSAEYAVKYTNSTGCLIMCYVALLNPFPVISDDAPLNVPSKEFRFYGSGNYSNYQCHYIPVAPSFLGAMKNFRPSPDGVEHASFDEFAIFQQSDILPQVIVHLKPGSSKSSSSPPAATPTAETSDSVPLNVFLSKE